MVYQTLQRESVVHQNAIGDCIYLSIDFHLFWNGGYQLPLALRKFTWI